MPLPVDMLVPCQIRDRPNQESSHAGMNSNHGNFNHTHSCPATSGTCSFLIKNLDMSAHVPAIMAPRQTHRMVFIMAILAINMQIMVHCCKSSGVTYINSMASRMSDQTTNPRTLKRLLLLLLSLRTKTSKSLRGKQSLHSDIDNCKS